MNHMKSTTQDFTSIAYVFAPVSDLIKAMKFSNEKVLYTIRNGTFWKIGLEVRFTYVTEYCCFNLKKESNPLAWKDLYILMHKAKKVQGSQERRSLGRL